jgi:hypothetical protein
MGKIDDMRKHREALFAQRERSAGQPAAASGDTGAAVDASPAVDADVEAQVTPARSRRLGGSSRAADGEGTCSGCNKVRAVHNGIIAVHQKGLGSVCPGSRKAPK